MLLNKLKDKKILILGFGREGRDTFLFLRKLFPNKVLGIADRVPKLSLGDKKTKLSLGEDYLGALKDYDIIVKSPGIPLKALPKSALGKITSQAEIFFENCPGKIIGVTGTKGKSTTCSLIYQILKKGGIKAHLLGNIGKPVLLSLLKAKKDDVFVYELSSFQLHNLKKSPQVAVLLNIYHEHLDYYRNFQEYVRAKANITKHQTNKDYLIYNAQDSLVKKIVKTSKAQKMPVKGKYYQLDIKAAQAIAKIFKVPLMKKFKFLPHRLEFIGKFKGIKFYNDSLSTIPETTMAALDFLGNQVATLILGGFDRGLDFKKLGQRIKKSKVKTLILFPKTGQRIWQEIRNQKINHFLVKDMKKAVSLAYQHTEQGKICLLSPASPSFGLFRDYEERGNLFKKFVKMLK